MLHLNPKLKVLIDRLWNRFWAGGISNPLSAIEQITYLLFMKQIDKLDFKRQSDAEFTGDTFTSRFEGDFYLPHDQARAKKLLDPNNNKNAKAKKENKAELKKLAIDTQSLRKSFTEKDDPVNFIPETGIQRIELPNIVSWNCHRCEDQDMYKYEQAFRDDFHLKVA